MLSVVCLLILAVMAAISVVSVLIYLRIYTRWVNRRLAGQAPGRPLWSPLRFCLTCAGVFGALLLVLFLYLAIAPGAGDRTGQQPQATYQLYSQADMEGTYLEGFSLEENPGYTRYTAQDDHFRYTCFLSQDPYDGMHPGFLVFVETIEDPQAAYTAASFYGTFQAEDTKGAASGWGAGGGVPEPLVCFVGSVSQFSGTFTGTYGLFTPEDFDRYWAAYEAGLARDELIDDLPYASVKAQFTLSFSSDFGTGTMTGTEGRFSLTAEP